MTNARQNILGAIRAALGPRDTTAETIAAQAAALVADPDRVRPDFGGVDLISRFIAKATSERVTATIARVDSFAGVPAAVLDYVGEAGLPAQAAVQPTDRLRGLDWAGLELADTPGTDGGLAVTLADYGVAETGSVVFHSGPDAPVLLNFLPLHHLVVLETNRILAYPEDVWPRLGGVGAPQSRLLTLVTGTSGTADIEAKNVRGAHGPRHMRIILVG
ncbi:lactate utilization protein C [Actibacterium sp.]|uniref:LutC/YkgG family protein n=1 Tax=Actibacterium sp. TaxID=1872125 RepID=UPI00356997BF